MASTALSPSPTPPSPPSQPSSSSSPPASPTPASRPKRERRPPQPVYSLSPSPGTIRERKRQRPGALGRRRVRREQAAEDTQRETGERQGEDTEDYGPTGSTTEDSDASSLPPSPVKRRRCRARASVPPPAPSQPLPPPAVLIIRLSRRLLKVRAPDGKFKTNLWVYDLIEIVGLDGAMSTPARKLMAVNEQADVAPRAASVVMPLRATVLSPPPSVAALPATTVRTKLEAMEEEEEKLAKPAWKHSFLERVREELLSEQANGGSDLLHRAQGEAVLDDSAEVAELVARSLSKYEDAWSVCTEATEAKASSSYSSPFRLRERVQAWRGGQWRDAVVICHAFNSVKFAQSLVKVGLAEELDGEARRVEGEWPITGVNALIEKWPAEEALWGLTHRDCYLLHFDGGGGDRWYLATQVQRKGAAGGDSPHRSSASIPLPLMRRPLEKEPRHGKEEKTSEPAPPAKRPPPPAAIDTSRPAFPSFLPLSSTSSSSFSGFLSPRDSTQPRQPPTTFPPSPPPPPPLSAQPLPMTSVSLLPSIDLQLAQVRSGSHPLILSALAQLQVKSEERRRVAERRRQEGLRLVEEEWKADMKELEEEWREEWRVVEERVLEEVREERRRGGGGADHDLGMAAHTRRRRGGLSGLPPGASRPPLRRRFHLEQKLSAGDRKADVERVKAMIAEQMGEEGKKRLQRIDQHIRGRLTWGGVHEQVRKGGGADGGPVVETRLRRRG